jgi:F-type H+-transporting ATPase subunit alpha
MQVISIYGANNGLLDGAPVSNVRIIEAKFHEFMEREMSMVVSAIQNERALSDDTESKLKEAMQSFKQSHPDLYTQ